MHPCITAFGLAAFGCSSPQGESPTTDASVQTSDAAADTSSLEASAQSSDATTEAEATADAAAGDGACVQPRPVGSIAQCSGVRPQLSPAGAAMDTPLEYLAQAGVISAGLIVDGWDPTGGLGDVTSFAPAFQVGPAAAYSTVQSAIDGAVAAADGGSGRVYIEVLPGTYRELVCVPPNAPPITLYGADVDSGAATPLITYGNYAGENADAGPPNPCASPSGTGGTFGTLASSTFIVLAPGFQAKNLTIANDVSGSTLAAVTNGGTQGVALTTQGDRTVLEDVSLLGHQDTLYLKAPGAGTVVRTYIKDSYIAGDVDFIFGDATAVLDGCTIETVTDRKTGGQVLAPSTNDRNPFGFLVVNSTFTADPGAAPATLGLGRAWDSSCKTEAYYATVCVPSCSYPNGQAVVRGSTIGAQYAPSPWRAAATTSRAFCPEDWTCPLDDGGTGACPGNRLFEYDNSGPGAYAD
jgi:pectinesterase